MKLLLTNDDGIDAEGLATLARVAQALGDVTVVAPHVLLSGCSHRVTDKQPLELTQVDGSRYALSGTPADCTRVGLRHLDVDADWVLSGINHGSNLGTDIYMSGTVAAVREAALLGRPAIAFSQYHRPENTIDWSVTAAMAARVLAELLPQSEQVGTYWNVNLPDRVDASAAEIVFCPHDPQPMPVEFEHRDGRLHYTGNYHDRPRHDGADIDVCFSGNIAVTRIVNTGVI